MEVFRECNPQQTTGTTVMSILQQPILVATAANDGVLGAALVLTGIVLAILFAVALHNDRKHRAQAGVSR